MYYLSMGDPYGHYESCADEISMHSIKAGVDLQWAGF
jgi:hypothetical protein